MGNDCWGPKPHDGLEFAPGSVRDDLMPPTVGSGLRKMGANPFPSREDVQEARETLGKRQDDYPSAEAKRIIEHYMPEFGRMFLEKNRKYAKVQTGHDLGPKGEVPDLNRKMGVLVDRLWHDSPTVGEETDEVVLDMIGHLFLLLDKLRS